MPIRTVCPGCSSTLSVPDSAGGKVIKCPKCQTSLRLPESATASPPSAASARSGTTRPTVASSPRQQDSDEDDRPRNKSRRKRKKSGKMPTWVKLTVGGVLVVVLGVGLLFTAYALIRS